MATLLAAAAAPAFGQATNVSYPPSRALNDIAAWIQRDTPLSLSQVVDVSPSAVTAVTSAAPMGETRGFLATVNSEAVDPAVVSHDGIASWSIPVEIDCGHSQARLGAMTGFRSRDLRSDPRTVRPADTAWISPVESSPLGSAIRALCDRDFHRPFAGRLKTAAKTHEPKPGPPPIVEVRPRRVAQAGAKPSPGDAAPNSTDAAPGAPQVPSRALSISIPARAASAVAIRLPKPKPPVGGGPHAVQIGASPNLADVQGLLTRFKKKSGAELGGLGAEIVTAQVDGKTVNRVIVSGFASITEAEAFCKKLVDARRACFIRR
ncbi:MAG: SPOR domain-containing protein [Pseudomonadota bacterium]|nr:SPOR domain-containing protein [Pseudomonadota bacterium]